MTWYRVSFEFVPHDPPPPRVERLELAPGAAPDIPPDAHRAAHLAQWHRLGDGRAEAHYVFDDGYVRAHPEALDPRHLGLLHALLICKFFDDGEIVTPPAQFAGSVRWPAVDVVRAPLGR